MQSGYAISYIVNDRQTKLGVVVDEVSYGKKHVQINEVLDFRHW